MEKHEIHIEWEGPKYLEDLPDLQDDNLDYGIYQIYGGHPVYGSSVLLYVGKAAEQTFGKRISQEGWEHNRDGENIEIYVGRLSGANTPENDDWNEEIALAESLLIYAHKPAFNSSSIRNVRKKELEGVHVFNWFSHRDLMAEVSGLRWSPPDEYDEYASYDAGKYD